MEVFLFFLPPFFVIIAPKKTVNLPLVALPLAPKAGFTSTGGDALRKYWVPIS
jgi:hypothetical protein